MEKIKNVLLVVVLALSFTTYANELENVKLRFNNLNINYAEGAGKIAASNLYIFSNSGELNEQQFAGDFTYLPEVGISIPYGDTEYVFNHDLLEQLSKYQFFKLVSPVLNFDSGNINIQNTSLKVWNNDGFNLDLDRLTTTCSGGTKSYIDNCIKKGNIKSIINFAGKQADLRQNLNWKINYIVASLLEPAKSIYALEETMSRTGLEFKLRNGKLKGEVQLNKSKTTVKLEARVVHQVSRKQIRVEIQRAKVGWFSVKGLLLKEVKKLESDKIRVSGSFIYVKYSD